MKLENQVCSLELAKRLKALNVKQESLFYWEKSEYKILINEDGNREIEEYRTSLCMPPYFDLSTSVEYWSAFSVAELGQLLGTYAESSKGDNGWYMRTISPIQKWKEMYPCKTEADARAKMLIYLLENNLMKAE